MYSGTYLAKTYGGHQNMLVKQEVGEDCMCVTHGHSRDNCISQALPRS